jgi:pyruvate kinase
VIPKYELEDLKLHPDHVIQDYMLYSVYMTSRELDIKAIICPTQSGYTPARLSALKPNVPIISFTKDDDAYRYLNLLW